MKPYLALIPFLLTTVGITIFLVFFNYGSITFSGTSPFTVSYNKEIINDQNGQIALRLPALDYNFKISSPNFFEQEIPLTIHWRDHIQWPIDLTFKAIANEKTFIPPFSYEHDSVILDNQKPDLFFSNVPPKTFSGIPKNYSSLVWAKDGNKACLFAPQKPEIPALRWQSDKGFSPLMTDTFQCVATKLGLMEIALTKQHLLINAKDSGLEIAGETAVTISNDGLYAAITTQDASKSSQVTIHVVTLSDLTTSTILTTGLVENPHFVGDHMLALRKNGVMALYKNPFDSNPQISRQLSTSTTVGLLTYSQKKDTIYYIDRRNPQPSVWSNLISNPDTFVYQLIANHNGDEYVLHTFNKEIDPVNLVLDEDERNLAVLPKDGDKVTVFQIRP